MTSVDPIHARRSIGSTPKMHFLCAALWNTYNCRQSGALMQTNWPRALLCCGRCHGYIFGGAVMTRRTHSKKQKSKSAWHAVDECMCTGDSSPVVPLLRKTRTPIVQLGWQSPAWKKIGAKQRRVFMLIFLAHNNRVFFFYFGFQLLLISCWPLRGNPNKRQSGNKSRESRRFVCAFPVSKSNWCWKFPMPRVLQAGPFLIRLFFGWDEKSERNHRRAIVFFPPKGGSDLGDLCNWD